MVAFFQKPTETSKKSRPYWRDDLFFWISTENLVKTRPTQKFWPLQRQILPPLELRSSCGTDMCVKKIVPHQPEASPHVTVAYSSFLWLLAYFTYERIYNISPKFAWTCSYTSFFTSTFLLRLSLTIYLR